MQTQHEPLHFIPWTFLILVTPLFSPIQAEESWLCSEASAVRSGNILTVCGIGEDENEGNARLKALKNAQKEFIELCEASSDCRNQRAILSPLRTTCERKNKLYRCIRGLKYELTNNDKSLSYLEHQKRLLEDELELISSKVRVVQELAEKEKEIEFLKEELQKTQPKWSPTVEGSTSGVFIALDFLNLGTSFFKNDGFTLSFGAGVRLKPWYLVGVDGGYRLDLFFPSQNYANVGSHFYVSLPFYFTDLLGAIPPSSIFIGPEINWLSRPALKVFNEIISQQKGWFWGVSMGWQDRITTALNYGWGLRVSIYPSVLQRLVIRVGFSYIIKL